MNSITSVLTQLLPPKSVIAGNWASILSTGTSHKTHLLSEGMKVNWSRDFLKKNKVQYLLLTRASFNNEVREYLNGFKSELLGAELISVFTLYNSDVFLFKINTTKHGKESGIRFEAENFLKRSGYVRYIKGCSGNLVQELPLNGSGDRFRSDLKVGKSGKYIVRLRAEGNFKAFIQILKDGKVKKSVPVNFSEEKLTVKDLKNVFLDKGDSELRMIITQSSALSKIDYIDFVPVTT